MAVRAVRGATCMSEDDSAEMNEAVLELLQEMIRANSLDQRDIISIIFTCTPDIHCGFPAASARQMGLTDVPLMCAVEVDVTGALPRTVRVMAHVETNMDRSEVHHVFLRGAQVLREDLIK